MRFSRFAIVLASLAVAGFSAVAERTIYPAPEAAPVDLRAALKEAAQTHKRVLLDFGGDWCGDCVALDMYMKDAVNQPIVAANFVLVHINVGNMDQNLDIAERFKVPLKKGVPALAVLSDTGKLLFSQENGEFEKMRTLQSADLTRFLVQWKPVKAGCSAVVVNC